MAFTTERITDMICRRLEESVIGNGFAEPKCLLHSGHVQVLDGNEVIGIR